MLADVSNNFWNICLEIYELYLARFFSAPVVAYQATLGKTTVKLDLLFDIDMLLIAEKGIIGGICHAINQYVKDSNKKMKDYDKIKESSYL